MVENDNSHPIDPWSRAAIDQNRQWLTAYVYSLTGKLADAEDIVQQVFTLAWQKRDGFREGTNFGGWLRTIARHAVLRHCRKKSTRLLFIDDDEVLNHIDRAAEVESRQMLDERVKDEKLSVLRKCIGKLGERSRSVIRMKYLKKLSSAEICRSTGLSVGHVNVIAFKARGFLMKCMKKSLTVS
jgi:RNA polymerase sigma factor (sigma-70 family)